MATGDIPKKIVIDGRLQFGKQFLKEAKSQLGILKHQMDYRSLKVGERVVKFNDDVHFICNVTHNQQTVTIITDPWTERVVEDPYYTCPKTEHLAYGFIDKLNGMIFNGDGDPVTFPPFMYQMRGSSWDVFICESGYPNYKYSYWESCKPFCFFVHDHIDDDDLGWVYDCRSSLARNRTGDSYEGGDGHPIIAYAVRNAEGIIVDYRITNIKPSGFSKWQRTLKYTTYKALRY